MIKAYIKKNQESYNTHTWKIFEENIFRNGNNIPNYICNICKHVIYQFCTDFKESEVYYESSFYHNKHDNEGLTCNEVILKNILI